MSDFLTFTVPVAVPSYFSEGFFKVATISLVKEPFNSFGIILYVAVMDPVYAEDLGVNVIVIGFSVTLTKSLFSSYPIV